MKYLLLALTTVLAMDVSAARADPIATFHVTEATMFMRPNVAGGNISFQFTGPGVLISGTGGMGCFAWCSGALIPPGAATPLTPISIVNFNQALVGGIVYEPNTEIAVSVPSFFDDSGGLSPIASGFVGTGPTFTAFQMTMPTNGRWDLIFAPAMDRNGNAALRFVNGTFSASAPAPSPTPEPGTLSLMLAGAAGTAWIGRRRRRQVSAHGTQPALGSDSTFKERSMKGPTRRSWIRAGVGLAVALMATQFAPYGREHANPPVRVER